MTASRPRPTITIAIAALAVVATATHGLGGVLVADAHAIAGGDAWRVVTGPLVHATATHLAWDVAVLLALGLAFEVRLGRAWPLAIAVGLGVPTLAVLATEPVAGYYGLSGVTHALAGAAAVHVLTGRSTALERALIAALVAKLAWELAGPATGIGPGLGAGVREVPVAHLAGVLAGACAGLVAVRRRDDEPRQPRFSLVQQVSRAANTRSPRPRAIERHGARDAAYPPGRSRAGRLW